LGRKILIHPDDLETLYFVQKEISSYDIVWFIFNSAGVERGYFFIIFYKHSTSLKLRIIPSGDLYIEYGLSTKAAPTELHI